MRSRRSALTVSEQPPRATLALRADPETTPSGSLVAHLVIDPGWSCQCRQRTCLYSHVQKCAGSGRPSPTRTSLRVPEKGQLPRAPRPLSDVGPMHVKGPLKADV